MLISSGGTASIVFNPWQGYISSATGAVVTYLEREADIYYGNTYSGIVEKYNSLSNFAIIGGKSAIVYTNGIANKTTVIDGALILSGGTANSTNINNYAGTIYVFSNGVANRTTVKSGCMYISNGGVANSTTVNSGASLFIRGTHRGVLNIASGAVVSAYTGATIDFSVADMTPQSNYLINNLSSISGAPTYTITVSDTQQYGQYKLAQNADAFTGTVTVGSKQNQFGSLTVNGNILNYNGRNYSLVKNNGNLLLTVSDEDLIPPMAPEVSVTETKPTCEQVVVTASFASDSVKNEYRRDNGEWYVYESGIIFTSNGTVSFRSTDKAGNVSEITTYNVTNIDRDAPRAPMVSASTEYVTNQDVFVSASFASDSVKNEYSLNNGEWEIYSSAVRFTENGTVAFRSTDAAGNTSSKQYQVINIDKALPTIAFSGNPDDWTKNNVVISAVANDDYSGVKSVEYSFDNAQWTNGSSVTVSENKTVYFRVTDNAGNITSDSVIIDKIDKSAPQITFSGIPGNWINKETVIYADVTDNGSGVKLVEYSFDNVSWAIGSQVTVSENSTVYFRATDNVGNISTESVDVKIDKDVPTLSITGNVANWTNKNLILNALAGDSLSGVKSVEYSFDNVSWTNGSSVTVSENKTVYFRVTDNAGNITSDSVIIDKIDKSAPVFQNIELSSEAWTFEQITVVPTVTDDIDFTLTYRIGNGAVKTYSGGSITVNNPSYVYFTAIDAAGNSSTQSAYVKAGYVPVSSGVTSTGLQVSRGILEVFEGGIAQNTAVSSGGTLINSGVVSGLQASAGAIISGGGRFYLTGDTAIASGVLGQTKNQSRIGASTFSNFVAAHDWHVDQKLLMKEVAVTSGGSMTLYRGASATILDNYGYAEILAKANARSTTVFSGAELKVNGGVVAATTVSKGGFAAFNNGGSGLRTSVYGTMNVESNGIVNSTTVFAQGTQTIGAKGLAKSGFVSSGGIQQVFGGSSYRDSILPGGSQIISQGGKATETKISAAQQIIRDKGYSESATVIRGSQHISSGGVAENTTLSGIMNTYTQTLTSSYEYSGDRIYWTSSGGVTSVLSSSWHQAETSSIKVYYYDYTGSQYVSSGGVVSNTLLASGSIQTVFAGGSAVDTTINANAFQYVLKNGSAFDTEVSSGGIYAIEYDGYGENVSVADGGAFALHGTVKNLALSKEAAYYFDLGTAVFQGNLDCYLNPADLNILNEILMFSELESLTLRVNATDFGQDQYEAFSTEANDSLDYRFILVLDDGKTVSMRDDSHYWYNGECYSLEYSEDDWQYYLNKSTQEKTRVLLSSANNIDILETQSSKVNWNRNSYQDYGEVIAIRETGIGKTVYLNTGVSVKGLLQNAAAVHFVSGGTLQLGTNSFAIDMYSRDDAEAVVYGVHNASLVQRRLASLPALPEGVTMNISAVAVNGSACAAAFINDFSGMTFSGGIAGAMQVKAVGASADARGIYADGTTVVTEPVTGSAAITAEAAGGAAYAIGISKFEADDFDADWNISAVSENDHAAAVGMTAGSLGQWSAVSDLLVTATAGKTAQAYGFAASDHAGSSSVEEFSVSELFKGSMQIKASGYDAEAAGIESKLSLNCNMGAEIAVAAEGRRNAEALGINGLDNTLLDGSVEISAAGEQTARAVGVNDMGNSRIAGTISVEAISGSGNAFACGWLGRADSLNAELTVYAEGSNEVKAFAFADYFDSASGGSLDTLNTNGKISVTAVSINVNDSALTPVYAIGGRINERLEGSICVSAVSANSEQETFAKAVHAEELTVTGVIGASGATQAVAVAANSENTQLTMTVSGTLFAGNAALNGSNDELLALLASPMDDLDALAAAKERIKNEAYAVYAYDENDVVTLDKGAVVIGNMALAGGNNTVTISNGAYYYGDINAENGDLTVAFVLDSQKEERAIITGGLEDLRSLSVDVGKIKADGCYTLVSGLKNGFTPSSVEVIHSGTSVTLTVGNMNFISVADSGRFRCYIENNELIFEAAGCQQNIIRDVTADSSGVSWIADPGDFTAELSRDGFINVLSLQLENSGVSTYGMPSGTWQWQVQYTGEDEVVSGNAFSAYAVPGDTMHTAKEDGFMDLFMLTPVGVWNTGYAAQHSGTPGVWGGTGELVMLDGKNRIADKFAGSEDANILVLTDDPNGDALFVDDIFTALGDQARFSQIDEIRAGAGDDIVDMTSQRFTYTGSGITVYGGLGDDVIWGSNGDHILFGDDGNDRITGGSGNDIIIGGAGNDLLHGGGGSDIFCFNVHCGNDSVEQLSNGRVTLYFEADTGYWDPEKLTYYFDADNSVSVSGVRDERIDIFFGPAAGLPDGCFAEAASEKIFEDKNKGMLA